MAQEALPTRLSTIRARAKEHQEELEAARWFTTRQLAARWGIAETTVREIPASELPYRAFGRGKVRKRRRYSPTAVAAFEAKGAVTIQESPAGV